MNGEQTRQHLDDIVPGVRFFAWLGAHDSRLPSGRVGQTLLSCAALGSRSRRGESDRACHRATAHSRVRWM
jgi:hypothetical protein